jgi:hypothetical protein
MKGAAGVATEIGGFETDALDDASGQRAIGRGGDEMLAPSIRARSFCPGIGICTSCYGSDDALAKFGIEKFRCSKMCLILVRLAFLRWALSRSFWERLQGAQDAVGK